MVKSKVKIDFDTKKLEKEILKNVRQNVSSIPIEISCPECGKEFEAHAGANTCPHCGSTVDLNIEVGF